MRSRIGVITKSYGRLIDFLLGIYFLYSREDSGSLSHSLTRKTTWFFPAHHMYPFLSSLLQKKGLKISDNFFFGLIYRFLSKVELHSLIDSTSHYDYQFYETMNQVFTPLWKKNDFQNSRKLLQQDIRESFHLTQIRSFHPFLANLMESDMKLCLLYFRNEDWDVRQYGKKSRVHLSEMHRNQYSDLTKSIVEIFNDNNYLVVRIGRDSRVYDETPYFFDYASKSFASDEIDFFLWNRADCLISSSGGADQPRMIFGVPTLFLNPKEPLGSLFADELLNPTFVLPPTFSSESGLTSLDELTKLGYMPNSKQRITSLRNFELQIKENLESTVSVTIEDFIAAQDIENHDSISSKFVKINGLSISQNWINLKA